MSTREPTVDKESTATQGMRTKTTVSMAPTAARVASKPRIVDGTEDSKMLKPSDTGPSTSKPKTTTTYVCSQYNTENGIEVEYAKHPGDWECVRPATKEPAGSKTPICTYRVEVATKASSNVQPSEMTAKNKRSNHSRGGSCLTM